MAGPVGRPDQHADRGHRRDPRPAQRHLRLAVAGARLMLGPITGEQASQRAADDGPGPAFWIGFVVVGAGGGGLSGLRGWLDRRQHGLLLQLDLHGAGAQPDLGLWRRAVSFGQTAFFGLAGYAYGILTHQLRQRLRLHHPGGRDRRCGRRRCSRRCWATSCSSADQRRLLGIVTLSVTLVFETVHGADRRPAWRVGTPGSTASTACPACRR